MIGSLPTDKNTPQLCIKQTAADDNSFLRELSHHCLGKKTFNKQVHKLMHSFETLQISAK